MFIKKIIFTLVLCAFSAFFISCDMNVNHDDWRNKDSGNIPAVVNTTNAFSFAIDAADFSFNEKYSVDFKSNSFSIGLTVSGYRNGTGHLDIYNEKDSIYYSTTLSNNIVLANDNIAGGPPHKIALKFTDFTGKVSIGIGGK
ncbi:MAG: hypothetical protein NTX22_15735 [Ignavibacteriales bacterium]|nr:hypothetical protein [Ignavibacteriales bacterium]